MERSPPIVIGDEDGVVLLVLALALRPIAADIAAAAAALLVKACPNELHVSREEEEEVDAGTPFPEAAAAAWPFNDV